MAPTLTPNKRASKHRPRVLIVDDEPDLLRLMSDVVGREVDCQLLGAADLSEARKILATEPIELLVTDLHLPDGNGMSLLSTLRAEQPNATAIVITGEPDVTTAISALRAGVADFLPKPFSATHLLERVNRALDKQRIVAKQEKRLGRLRGAVRRLNISRRTVTKKVDLLCNDLVAAYGELSKQMDDVRHQDAFRKLLGEAHDLEQLLCHAMDWLLRHAGYSNVAVWLSGDNDEFQLGAYMKYTIAGEPELTNAMSDGLLEHVCRDGLIHWSAAQAQQKLSDRELEFLVDQTVLATNCTYLGESLAAIVLFRDDKSPFSEADVAMVKAISPLFATALASIVRRTGADGDEDGGASGDTLYEDDGNNGGGEKRKPKPDADWWKRGEAPPF